MSPEKKVADEEGSPKNDSTKRQEVTGNDNNHDEDDVASDISSNSSLGFEDDEEVGAKNKIGVNRIVPDYTSDVSSDDLSGRICVRWLQILMSERDGKLWNSSIFTPLS